MRKFVCLLIVCAMICGNPFVTVHAVDGIDMCEYVEDVVSPRATNTFNTTVSANGRGQASQTFSLEAGEKVRVYATYSPRTATVAAGLVDPDGIFHYMNATNGIIDMTILIEKSGEYRFAVKNNSSYTITISGYVSY